MYSTPQNTPAPAQKSRAAQLIVTGVVVLVIVGWFLRDWNLATRIENLVWEVKKVTMGEAKLYMDEGIANLEKGDFEAAITSFSQVIRLEPTNGTAHNKRAEVYCLTQNEEKCRADLDKAIELEPDIAEFYYDRPYMLFQRMSLEEVYADLNKAIELDANHHYAHLFRAMLNEDTAKWDESIADYSVALATIPEGAPTINIYKMYDGQANGYIEKGMYPEAIANYNKIFEVVPEFVYLLQEKESEWQMLLEELEPDSDAYSQLEELIMKIQ